MCLKLCLNSKCCSPNEMTWKNQNWGVQNRHLGIFKFVYLLSLTLISGFLFKNNLKYFKLLYPYATIGLKSKDPKQVPNPVTM